MKKILTFSVIALLFFSCRKQAVNPETLPDGYSNQAIGQSARDLLSADYFTSLKIQVQYMPGYPLDTAALASVNDYLNMLCHKPGGITITQAPIAASGDTLDVSKVAVLERQNRTAYNSGNILALYVMVTDGYDTSSSILGFAYRNTSICIFGKNIYDHSGAPGQYSRTDLETSILEHELGHLLGLVNLGTPMLVDHQDAAHGNHCINSKCLMYWAMETHAGFHTILNVIPVLDSNCRMDLTANGGK